MKIITSRSNPLCVHLRKLASSRSYREETGEFLCDSPKLLREAALWGADVTALLCTEGVELPQGLENRIPQAARTGESVMRSVSPMETPQGVVFSCAIPRSGPLEALAPDEKGPCRPPDCRPPERLKPDERGRLRFLVLDGVQDPGNVGTILRTADAFSAVAVLLPGCADLYNPKTLRAGMGIHFRSVIYRCGLEELTALLKEAGLPLYGAALREDTEDVRRVGLGRGAVIIGSEGRGVSREALSLCGRTIKIPMSPRCESLNAAVAASVILWEMARND